MRVAFVRQLANNRELIREFGVRPPPIARAVGLHWPDAAREIVEQASHVASAQFDPNGADPFELITYTRALAALAPRVGPAVTDAAKQNIARAINGLAEEKELAVDHCGRSWKRSERLTPISTRRQSGRRAIGFTRSLVRPTRPPAPAGAIKRSAARSR